VAAEVSFDIDTGTEDDRRIEAPDAPVCITADHVSEV
jgi:hypothetical protein